MNNFISRLVIGLAGFVLAFGAGLSALPDGNELTLEQVFDVPLLVWVLSLGAFFTSFVDGKILNRSKSQ